MTDKPSASVVAFIFHGVENMGDHAESYRHSVMWNENATVKELVKYLSIHPGRFELVLNVDGMKELEDTDNVPF